MTPRNLLCVQLSADIYLRSKGNEASPIIIGRASAKVDENGFAGISAIDNNVLYIDIAHLWHLNSVYKYLCGMGLVTHLEELNPH